MEPEQTPHRFGFDASELETSVRAAFETQQIVGLSVSVLRAGGTVWSACFGHADLETATANSVETSYLWFSMTKIVTATAVLQLVDNGSVSLDAPVTDYLPEFAVVRQPVPVTVRHLLAHSSGLANPIPIRWVHPATVAAPDPASFLAAQLQRHRRLHFEPGSEASYTNLGYLALGQIVANVAGVPYTRYVGNDILEPLGMGRTRFDGPHGPDEATIYQGGSRLAMPLLRLALPSGIVGNRSGRWVAYRPFRVDGIAYGGLIGSAADAMTFAGSHLGLGATAGVRILNSASAELMQRISTRGKRYDLGLGWYRPVSARTARPQFVEHLGGGLGVYNTMRLYPELDLAVVVMANTTGYDVESIMRPILSLTTS
jgi:CubicO group peptidase (beta-lactamase class C family)